MKSFTRWRAGRRAFCQREQHERRRQEGRSSSGLPETGAEIRQGAVAPRSCPLDPFFGPLDSFLKKHHRNPCCASTHCSCLGLSLPDKRSHFKPAWHMTASDPLGLWCKHTRCHVTKRSPRDHQTRFPLALLLIMLSADLIGKVTSMSDLKRDGSPPPLWIPLPRLFKNLYGYLWHMPSAWTLPTTTAHLPSKAFSTLGSFCPSRLSSMMSTLQAGLIAGK